MHADSVCLRMHAIRPDPTRARGVQGCIGRIAHHAQKGLAVQECIGRVTHHAGGFLVGSARGRILRARRRAPAGGTGPFRVPVRADDVRAHL